LRTLEAKVEIVEAEPLLLVRRLDDLPIILVTRTSGQQYRRPDTGANQEPRYDERCDSLTA
jgi:hypothetical protein